MKSSLDTSFISSPIFIFDVLSFARVSDVCGRLQSGLLLAVRSALRAFMRGNRRLGKGEPRGPSTHRPAGLPRPSYAKRLSLLVSYAADRDGQRVPSCKVETAGGPWQACLGCFEVDWAAFGGERGKSVQGCAVRGPRRTRGIFCLFSLQVRSKCGAFQLLEQCFL